MISCLIIAFTLAQAQSPEKSDLLELTDENFQKSIESAESLFILFYFAAGSESTTALKSMLALSQDFVNLNLKLGIAEKNANPNSIKKYNVMNTPSYLFFVNGSYIPYTGVETIEGIREWVTNHVKKPYSIVTSQEDINSLIVSSHVAIFYGDPFSDSFELFEGLWKNRNENITFAICHEKTKIFKSENKKSPFIVFYENSKKYIYSLSQTFGELSKSINTMPPPFFEWNEVNENDFINKKKNAIYLVLFEKDFIKQEKEIQAVHQKYWRELPFFYIKFNTQPFKEFAEKFMLTGEGESFALIIQFGRERLKYKTTEISYEGLNNFIEKWSKTKLKPYYVSEYLPEPKIEKGIHVLNRKNFDEVTQDPNTDVVVLMYNGEEMLELKFVEVYERVAFEVTKLENLAFYKINMKKNEFDKHDRPDEFDIYYFPRNNKDGIKFIGLKSKYKLMKFLRSYRDNWIF